MFTAPVNFDRELMYHEFEIHVICQSKYLQILLKIVKFIKRLLC